MTHLTPDQFIDAAEGARPEASLPHLAVCEPCRQQLATTRAAMTATADIDVPEPPAFFWERLQARVNERIDADRSTRRWWSAWIRPGVLLPVAAVALLAIVVSLAPGSNVPWRSQPGTSSAPAASTPVATVDPANEAVDLAADPLLTLVSDLSANMDWDGAAAAGLAERGSADQVVAQLNTDELRALKQLLQTELARRGA